MFILFPEECVDPNNPCNGYRSRHCRNAIVEKTCPLLCEQCSKMICINIFNNNYNNNRSSSSSCIIVVVVVDVVVVIIISNKKERSSSSSSCSTMCPKNVVDHFVVFSFPYLQHLMILPTAQEVAVSTLLFVG